MSQLDIFQPTHLQEVFTITQDEAHDARPMGGGTALMLMMKSQLYKPSALISLAKCDKRFLGIQSDGKSFSIGALTTFNELEHNKQITTAFPIIAQTMHTLANPRVRNVATLGGNLAHADPHLDMPPVWCSLDAHLHLIGPEGERHIPVVDLFAGYYETTLHPHELIMRVHVSVQEGWQRYYAKITTRSAHDWPAIGLALGLKPAGGQCDDIRIILSAATDRPTRLYKTETMLRNQPLNAKTIAQCADAAAQEAVIKSDDRGSADYKYHLLKVHLQRRLMMLAGVA
jgi:aerobic carbon-monoxide dehydrogenase medium subunit